MSKMIPYPESYFSKFVPVRDEFLVALEREAQQEGIPIVGPVVGELLYILFRATGARTILELGTANGYSTIYLARACQSAKGRVITIDWDQDMAIRAKTNLEKCGLAHLAEIMVGDAIDLMASMDGPFDFIFMDIDKECYADALPHCLRLLRIGGLLITDNVGFQSADTFNREILGKSQWRVVSLFSFLPMHSPEKDGLSLALRVK